jgi:hypothetical protein
MEKQRFMGFGFSSLVYYFAAHSAEETGIQLRSVVWILRKPCNCWKTTAGQEA